MEDDKRTYYISVQSDSILKNKEDAAFEFEIQATEQQISRLQELFDSKSEADNYGFGRAHVPFLEYSHDKTNDAYDYYLAESYRMIHELGTPETKRMIESMNVLHQGISPDLPKPESFPVK